MLSQLMLVILCMITHSIPVRRPAYCRQRLSMAGRDELIVDGFALILERQLRPGQIYVPRKRMDLQFAVLLMRSSYSVADEELNYVRSARSPDHPIFAHPVAHILPSPPSPLSILQYPMDDFQRQQFLFRQSEWEWYRDKHQSCMQGDLAGRWRSYWRRRLTT